MKLAKFTFVFSVISLLIIGFGQFLILDRFFDYAWYNQAKQICFVALLAFSTTAMLSISLILSISLAQSIRKK